MTFKLEAKENYSAALVAQFPTNAQPLYVFLDACDVGLSFDFLRRKLRYIASIATGDHTLNNTGFTLWDGVIAVANGVLVNTVDNWNLWFCEKDIDTDAVTFYELYNVANTVPLGVGSNSIGDISFAVNPANGTNIVLNGTVWTFVAGAPAGNQTQIQVDLMTTIRQLSWDLNNSLDVNVATAFYVGATLAPGVNLNVEFLVPGIGGDAYTLGVGTAGSGSSGATLTGGTNTASDGTWRRMSGDAFVFGSNLPIVTDPRTGNAWFHVESCRVYHLRLSDNFQQKISPMVPLYNHNNPIYPIGLTVDWFMGFENDEFGGTHQNFLYLSPVNLSALDTQLDKLLRYAEFPFPAQVASGVNGANFRWCCDDLGNIYFIAGQNQGGKHFKFWKFTPPAKGLNGIPISGGGFTDITPWAAGTGPNTNNAAYTLALDGGQWQASSPAFAQNLLYYLPATKDFVTVTQNYNIQAGFFRDQYEFTFFDCTYINVAGAPTFDFHSAFVTGYMDASWKPSTLANAAYAVMSVQEHNLYLNSSDFIYGGVDYSKRWLLFNCYTVSNGVVNLTSLNFAVCVFVQYQFVNGQAPKILQFWDEQNGDGAYAVYGQAIKANVGGVWPANVPVLMQSSAFGPYETTNSYDLYINDNGVYDDVKKDFWWSGNNSNWYDFDPVFVPRSLLNGGSPIFNVFGTGPNPPLLKFAFSSGHFLPPALIPLPFPRYARTPGMAFFPQGSKSPIGH